MELKESNYPACFLLLTVISDSRNMGENLQTGGFIENQNYNGKKKYEAICCCTVQVTCKYELEVNIFIQVFLYSPTSFPLLSLLLST